MYNPSKTAVLHTGIHTVYNRCNKKVMLLHTLHANIAYIGRYIRAIKIVAKCKRTDGKMGGSGARLLAKVGGGYCFTDISSIYYILLEGKL